MEIITRKGWLNSISQTSEHPDYGAAYVVVKAYDQVRDGARQNTTNLEVVVRRPGEGQALVYVLADNDGWTYPAGTPVHTFNIDSGVTGDQIDGKAGPSSCGWRLDGSLEIAANLRIYRDGTIRQAWVRVVLREVDGVWQEG